MLTTEPSDLVILLSLGAERRPGAADVPAATIHPIKRVPGPYSEQRHSEGRQAGSVDDVLRTSRYVKRGEKEEEEMGIRFK